MFHLPFKADLPCLSASSTDFGISGPWIVGGIFLGTQRFKTKGFPRWLGPWKCQPWIWDKCHEKCAKCLTFCQFQHGRMTQCLSTISTWCLVTFQLSIHPLRQFHLTFQLLFWRSMYSQSGQGQNTTLHGSYRIHGCEDWSLEVLNIILGITLKTRSNKSFTKSWNWKKKGKPKWGFLLQLGIQSTNKRAWASEGL